MPPRHECVYARNCCELDDVPEPPRIDRECGIGLAVVPELLREPVALPVEPPGSPDELQQDVLLVAP